MTLAELKANHAELEKALESRRETVACRLEAMAIRCYGERGFLESERGIADYELHVNWDLLNEAVAALRETETLLRLSSERIREMEEEPHD